MRRQAVKRCAAYLEQQNLPAWLQRHTPSQQLVNLRNFSYLQPATTHSAPLFMCSSALPVCPQLRAFNSKACRSGISLLKAGNRQPSLPVHTILQQACCVSTNAASQAQAVSRAHRQRQLQGKPGQQGLYLVALVVGMVGVTYASVPLYRMFCQATGYGGTVQQGNTVEEKLRKRAEATDSDLEAAAAAREITVSFNADVTDGMNWRFWPTQRSVKLNPGQSTLAFYTAHNLSDKAITGVSTYNVSPQQAGAYFNKIQCFCFEEQKLRPGEKIDMPVFFYIDPEFATDPRMRGIDQLTLSYTFFKVAEEEDDTEDENAHQKIPQTHSGQLAAAQ